MVHQSRFDRLAVAFTYADGHIAWERVASGAFGTRWRVGGQVAVEAPSRDAPLVSITMRFDHLPSHKPLRIRIVTNAEAWAQSAMQGGVKIGSESRKERVWKYVLMQVV